MDSGVATRPIADFDAYREQLDQFVYQLGHDDGAGVRGRASARPSASSTPKARTSACCARRRSRSTRASCARARRSHRRHQRRASRSSGCGSSSGENCDGRQHPRRSALPRVLRRSTTSSARRRGVSRAQAREEMRSRPTLIGGDARAPRRRRRDAVRHARATIATTCATSATSSACAKACVRLRRCRC